MRFNYPMKLHIITYGCQMNVYDSQQMKNLLRKKMFDYTDNINEADLIILNTCNIREKAAEKVYSELGKIQILKKERIKNNLDLLVVVAGCVSQAEGDVIFKRAPIVDIVVGPQSYQSLPTLIDDIMIKSKSKLINLDFDTNQKFDFLPEESLSQGASAFLTIQEGCDKFCKFCCVPYTRGPEFSRMPNELYREAMKLVSLGAKEITLLGQNVSAYDVETINKKNFNLADLIKLIATIPSLKRIRYTTSHPLDMDEKLMEIHAQEPKLMPFIHLPVQSGSNKILKEMNRKHTAEHYIKIIEGFRSYNKNIAFSSDFIVGYPGETEQDFNDTLALVKEVGFASSYSFKYSIRPGTPAANKEQVPEEIKTERIIKLQELLAKQQYEFNKLFEGKIVDILFDKQGKRANQIIGKSEYLQSVIIEDDFKSINSIKKVVIKEVGPHSLKGELLKQTVAA